MAWLAVDRRLLGVMSALDDVPNGNDQDMRLGRDGARQQRAVPVRGVGALPGPRGGSPRSAPRDRNDGCAVAGIVIVSTAAVERVMGMRGVRSVRMPVSVRAGGMAMLVLVPSVM